MPTTSIDTFFACTIIVAAALIATVFLGSTLQARISTTQDLNKDSYLQAIALYLVTSPGSPVQWGKSTVLPEDFGLAAIPSSSPYELDIDKVSRLNSNHNNALSITDLSKSTKLSNVALGIVVSQILSVNMQQISNQTVGNQITFTFEVSTSINSKPTSTSLQYYVIANNYLLQQNSTINGTSNITLQIPSAQASNALLVMFARAPFDERLTSFGTYDFATGTQKSGPSNHVVSLSPHDYVLSVNSALPGVTVSNAYVFSFTNSSQLQANPNNQFSFPKIADKSPLVLVVCGNSGAQYFQEWTAYPQVPLNAGSTFEGSAKNVFSYIVTVREVLYRLDIVLGDVVY